MIHIAGYAYNERNGEIKFSSLIFLDFDKILIPLLFSQPGSIWVNMGQAESTYRRQQT
jgi:hypothetical protein